MGMMPGRIGIVMPARTSTRARQLRSSQAEVERSSSGRTSVSARLVPPHEDVDVVEELRDDEIGAGLLLLEQVLDVGELVGRVGMAFRVPCSASRSQLLSSPSARGSERGRTSHADAERVAVLLADVADEVGRVLEHVARRRPVLLAAWRICVARGTGSARVSVESGSCGEGEEGATHLLEERAD